MFHVGPGCVPPKSWFITKLHIRYLSTRSSESLLSESTAYCKDIVRKHDYEGFLISHFYPKELQSGFLALKAFSIEMAMLQDTISNETIGKLKFQFWRDSIQGISEGTPPQHPIALTLHEAASHANISPYHLKRVVDARDAESHTPTHFTIESLTAHAESTSGTILYSLLSLLSLPSATLYHAASHLGIAQTFTTLLRGFTFHATKGRVIIPTEITAKYGVRHEEVFRLGAGANGINDAVFEFATLANDHLLTARDVFKQEGINGKIPERAMPLFLAGIPVSNYLKRLEKADFNVFAPELHSKDWRLPWHIWRGFYKREF